MNYNKDLELPVLLLTGYLGSGKTTLLNRILSNEKGIRFAVIVNDIGEVNIDASLIQKGGIVGNDKEKDDLVALQNGCICCTLKTDLIEQLRDLCASRKFDYIVIEASGICEPEPIAATIVSMHGNKESYTHGIYPELDCIATVVDALRMRDEFECGNALQRDNIGEEDLESLVVQQIEFCDLIVLNKVSEISEDELNQLKVIIRALQPKAKILECDYADVPLNELLNTGLFDFERTSMSAAWLQHLDDRSNQHPAHQHDNDEHEHHEHHEHHDEHCDVHHDEHCGHDGHHCDHDHDEHCTCHHHHHHHGEGEAEEYGIQTFVYFRRRPFDLNKLDYFVAKHWPKSVIRTKGVIYFSNETEMSYIFEQAGSQKQLTRAGYWYATAPEEELKEIMAKEPKLREDWDEKYGDRMIKLVFIGRNMDRKAIEKELDECLADE